MTFVSHVARSACSAAGSAGLLLVMAVGAPAGDWPQYRFDAQRSAASPAELPVELELLWVRELPPPRPAFPNEVRLRFDRSYEPVVLGKTMFVPSMVTDSVAALDTETGEERWVFFTDGPVRFAPAAGESKVYVVSDDGFLYCLDAAEGTLLWKFRGAPADRDDRRVLGNGRLISLRPARGGPLLEDGVVYFAAGLWPQDGVFVHALDARTGEPIWSNTTSDQIESANVDHGINQYAGITPQGYLARVHDKLVVPCGAQLPAFLDPRSGELESYTMGWGGRVGLPKGTWFAAGGGKYLSHGGDLYDLTRQADDEEDASQVRRYMTPEMRRRMYPGGWTRLMIDPSNQRDLAGFRRPVITPEAMYYNDIETGITAFDLTDVQLVERGGSKPPAYRAGDFVPDRWKGDLRPLWSLASDLEVHIKAGNRLYAGGTNTVQAIQLPEPGGEAKVAWTAAIEGTPHTMLAADDKLFVVTLEGRINAFGEGATDSAIRDESRESAPAPRDKWSELAEEILDRTQVREGYALVLGIDEGRLVEELLVRSKLQVIAVASDEDRVRRLRERLYRAGLYGTRATVHLGEPLSYPFPPFMANLIVSEVRDQWGDWSAPSAAAALFHPLRPYGGMVCLPAGSEDAEELTPRLQQAELPGSFVRRSGPFVLLTREGPLPGASAWSHAGGDASNTAASQDRFVKPPLDLLWFDGSLRWHRKPGSADVRVAGGRVFMKTDQLTAIDAYTGRVLWSVALPKEFAAGSVQPSVQDGVVRWPSGNPAGSVKPAQMVALDDGVYLATGSGPCLAFEPATGKQIGTIDIPDGLTGNWDNLRISGDSLVATIGRDLVCLDRRTGKLVWKFTCGRPALAAAVGSGRVFCCELLNPRREAAAEEAGTRLRAFDLASGELLWERPCGHAIHYGPELDWILTAHDTFDGGSGERVRDGAESPQIAGTQLISGSKDSFTLFELTSTDAAGKELEWERRGCTDLRASCHLVTTRYKANAAYVDLATLNIIPIWNIRPGCGNANNLIPADGLLNVPNVTAGCECNYTPVSQAFAPRATMTRPVR